MKMSNAKLKGVGEESKEKRRKAELLLYQMMPKSVAQRLKKGEATIDTCTVGILLRVYANTAAGISYKIRNT